MKKYSKNFLPWAHGETIVVKETVRYTGVYASHCSRHVAGVVFPGTIIIPFSI